MKQILRLAMWVTLAVAFVWVTTSPPAIASDAATLSGLVYTVEADQEQSVWPNARVTLKNLKTGGAVSTVSSQLGEYNFVGLDPGEYELSVTLAGFETETKRVKLEPKAQLHVDVVLRPKTQTEKVLVEAQAPGVDVTSTSTAGPTLQQTTLHSLPLVNEQFEDALPLLPGVVRGPDGLIDIKGARAYQSGTLVNSVSVVDPVTGQSAISLPLEAVQSVKVLPNPFSAEYGRFAGGVTEVQTRSGTDEWKFLLTNFFPRARVRAGTISGLESITPRLTFAGPLKKGKLFFFQSFEYRFVRTPVFSLPPLQRDSQFETFDSYTRFDWNITPDHLFTGSVSVYPQNLRFVNLNTFNPQETTPNFRQRGYFIHLNERSIFSAGGFLESSFSAKRYDAHVFPAQQGNGEFSFFPEQNFGNWFDQQDRQSHVYEWAQTYHVRPFLAHGTHLVTAGYSYDRLSYDGEVQNKAVMVLREDRTLSQVVDFTGPATLSQDQNAVAAFIEDEWSVFPRLMLNFGLRLDRQDLSRDALNPAPRFAFVFSPARNKKTAIRGGLGLFYSRMPLDLGTFLAYPAEIVTFFATDGVTVVQGPISFPHSIAASSNGLRVPYSLTWNLQVDHELRRRLLFRFGYEQRKTHRDFFIEPVIPIPNMIPESGQMLLFNSGRQDYREFQWTLRWDATERTTLFGSYVRSRATGELNDFDQFFGNFPNPIIRPNQHGALPYDAPNRFLFWGTIGLPWKLLFSPVFDIHDGFPFSRVDNDLNFVGPRNRDRFPTFASFDFQLTRPFRFHAFGRTINFVAGLKIFNATNHFNPRDVQENIFSPNFGAFYNSVGREYRGKFEFNF